MHKLRCNKRSSSTTKAHRYGEKWGYRTEKRSKQTDFIYFNLKKDFHETLKDQLILDLICQIKKT